MSEQTAIVKQEVEEMRLGALITKPADVIKRATAVSRELAKIIDDRQLYTQIGKKKFVHVEGWSTLGAMLGVLPREVTEETRRLEDGSYEATVELIRTSDGAVIGKASALVGMDEKDRYGKFTWANRPDYARRSMAITRATGKAYRLGFSWIMTLAGYEPTPAEEMDGIVDGEFEDEKPEQPAKSNGKSKERPLHPMTLREMLDKKAAGYGDKKASSKQRGLVVGMLDSVLQDETKRHMVCKYLFGAGSSKEMSDSQILAALDWLKPTQDSGGAYLVDADAEKEIKGVYNAVIGENQPSLV